MRRWWRCMLCIVLCAALGLLLSGTVLAEETAGGLEVHFLDIGRNDGILIRCGGEDVFIDSGGYWRGVQAVEYMQGVGVTSLKYYIGTHAHEDHIGGAPAILDAFDVPVVIQPHKRVKEAIIGNIHNADERAAVNAAEFVNMAVGQKISVGGATLTCLGPQTIVNVHPTSGTENENSLILMLTYGDVDILLAADATKDIMLAADAVNPGCLKADVYKNAHHDQYMNRMVFELIDPDYTIFSTADKSWPDERFTKMLNEFECPAFATAPAHSGNIILRTDGVNITFDPQNTPKSMTFENRQIEMYAGTTQKTKIVFEPSNRKKLLLYSSSDPSVAEVDYNGKITALKSGQAVITAKDASGMQVECVVTVKPVELKFKKSELTVKDGSKTTASYSILPSGTKAQVVWASADENIAAVDQKGKITGIYPGETIITATVNGEQTSGIKVTVTPIEVKSVSIKPSSVTMTIGDSKNVTASVSPSNATWKDIVWSSADESILTVDESGLLKAVGVGKTKLTATAVNGKSKTINVTVKPVYVKKIIPEASTVELICGMAGYDRAQLSYVIEPAEATIKNVTWKSSNAKVVAVNENGVITALKAGNATITCTAADGSGKSTKIKVYVEVPTERVVLKESAFELYEGKTKTISAQIQPRSKTKTLTYTSSNEEVAVVSSSGKVTGIKAGTAVIRVSDKMGVYAECIVAVRPATMFLKKSEITLKDGKYASASYSIQPSGSKPVIEWASMNEQIATVDQKGKITGQYPGETVITATMPSGQVSEIRVTVTPVNASKVTIKPSSVTMTIGDKRSVSASVSPSNATWQEITWSSADTSIASITQDGMITVAGVGETTITATTPEGKTKSAKVKVKPVYVKKITLTQPNIQLIGGVNGRNQVQLSYGIEPANATIQNVTWSSSNKKVATVDENGVVTGLKAGSVTITCKAADGSDRSAKIKLTFGENQLSRSVQAVTGEMVVQAERIRYTSSGSVLEIKMAYKNRSGLTQPVPQNGFLVLRTAEGEKIVLKQITGSQESLRNGKNDSFTYKIPVSTNPRLVGLDLSRCDAVMMTAQEAFAN